MTVCSHRPPPTGTAGWLAPKEQGGTPVPVLPACPGQHANELLLHQCVVSDGFNAQCSGMVKYPVALLASRPAPCK